MTEDGAKRDKARRVKHWPLEQTHHSPSALYLCGRRQHVLCTYSCTMLLFFVVVNDVCPSSQTCISVCPIGWFGLVWFPSCSDRAKRNKTRGGPSFFYNICLFVPRLAIVLLFCQYFYYRSDGGPCPFPCRLIFLRFCIVCWTAERADGGRMKKGQSNIRRRRKKVLLALTNELPKRMVYTRVLFHLQLCTACIVAL